jgi:hypothetical protein
MNPDVEALEGAVARAREHVQDVMRRQTDDPRSRQLLDQALREANAALRSAKEELERAR